jgi:hypothetical protein
VTQGGKHHEQKAREETIIKEKGSIEEKARDGRAVARSRHVVSPRVTDGGGPVLARDHTQAKKGRRSRL